MVEAPWFEDVKDERGQRMSYALATLAHAVQAPTPDNHSWDIDVKSLAKFDFDLTPRRRDQSGLDKVLGSLPSEVKILPLGELCHVMSGRRSGPMICKAFPLSRTSSHRAKRCSLTSNARKSIRNVFSSSPIIPFPSSASRMCRKGLSRRVHRGGPRHRVVNRSKMEALPRRHPAFQVRNNWQGRDCTQWRSRRDRCQWFLRSSRKRGRLRSTLPGGLSAKLRVQCLVG